MRVSLEEGRLGSLLVILAACLWGTTGIGAKLSYGFGATPEGILSLRLALMIPMYIALSVLRRTNFGNHAVVAVLGVAVMGPFQLTYYYAIKYVGASTASLILYTYPVLVAFLSRYFLGEALTARTYIALALSVVGAALVSFGNLGYDPLGLALAAASSFLFALYIVASRTALLRGAGPDVLAIGTAAWASLPVYTFHSITRGPNLPTSKEILAIAAYLAVVVTAIAYFLYMVGMKFVGASKATILSATEPLTATILSYIIFSEPLTPLKIAGGVLIVTAVSATATT